jgi:putative hemolysin
MLDPSPISNSATSAAALEHRPPIDELRGPYRVRFARDKADVEACCRMRYEVFNVELGEGFSESEATGLDVDPFDEQCNHLLVLEETSGLVVGTYRMQTAGMARAGTGFYSESEFDLSGLPHELREESVELGRACVAKTHRNKVVLFLLWRGLMAYGLWNRKRYFFGCSSLTSQDPQEGHWAFETLERGGRVEHEWLCRPLTAYACEAPGYESNPEPYAFPSLFSTYLRHGARICSPPALDRFFGTIDFLTLLDETKFERRLAEVFAQGLPRR